MKKNKLVTTTVSIVAFLGASALTVACKAPGSSRPIVADDPVNGKFGNNVDGPSIRPLDPNKDVLPEVTPPEPLPIQPEVSTNFVRQVSPVFIKADEKIKYVALGDSITAGFDGGLLQDYPGTFKDGKIEGASYPAFLAQLLNQDNRIESFANFAASGARAIDWIKMLDVAYENPYTDSPSWDKLDQTFAGRLGFGKFQKGYAKEVAQQTKEALKDANLVTLSIGANDFFFLLTKHLAKANPMAIINELKKPQPDYLRIYKFVDDAINFTIPEVTTRVKRLVDELTILAPNANINLVTYPMPMSGLKKSLDDFIKGLIKINLPIDPIVVLLDQINKPFKQLSELLNQDYGSNNRVSIVNAYNPQYWSSHSADLSDVYFDIHPNTTGYKKLALDMYLKMTNPSANLVDYPKGYDLTSSFIDGDALTLKYQIKVNKTPQEVIGANTQEFLDKNDEFLTKINQTRSPYNYGERLLRMSQTFKNITIEAITAVTGSAFYKSLDPEGKLAKLILDAENNGENGFESIVQAIIDDKVIQKIMGDFQAELSKRNKVNELKLTDIPSIFLSKALTSENLFKLVNALAKSNFINSNKAELADALTTVVDNLFKKNQDVIVNAIIKALDGTLSKVQISKEDVAKLLNTVISSPQLSNILNALIKTFISNSDQFQKVKNVPELVKAFLSDDENIKQMASSLSEFAWDILNNETIKHSLQDIVWKLINQYHLENNLVKDQSDALISNILDNISQFKGEKTSQFISDFISQFLIEMKDTPFENISRALTNALNDSLNKLLGKKDEALNISIFKVINVIVDTKIVENNKTFIKQLLHNLVAQSHTLKLSNVVYKVLPEALKDIVTQDGFATLFNTIISNEHTNAIISSIIDNLIDNFNDLKDSSDIAGLVQNLIGTQDLDALKTHLKAISDELLNNQSIQDTILSLMRKALEAIKPESNITDEEISPFLKDIKSSLFTYAKKLDVLNPLIDQLFISIQALKTSQDFYATAKNIPTDLINVLKEKLLNDPWTLINDFVDSQALANNKPFIKKIANYLFTKLNVNNKLVKQLKDVAVNAINKANIDKYAQKDEVTKLLSDLFDAEEITTLIPQAINFIIDNLQYVKFIKTPSVLVEKLFADVEFKKLIQEQVKPLLLKLVSDFKAPKTFAKLIKYLASNNNIQIEDKYDALLENIVDKALNKAWNDEKISNILSLVIDKFAASDNLNSFTNGLPKLILDNLNINAFDLVKGILVYPVDKKDYELYEKFINSLFSQVQQLASSNDPNFLTQLIGKIQLPEAVTKYNISSEDAQKFILRVLKSNSFNKFSKAFTKAIISNQNALATSTNFKELAFVFLKDGDLISELKSVVQRVINKFNDVPEFSLAKKALVSVLAQALSSNDKISWIFAVEGDDNHTQLKAFLSSVFDLILKSQEKLKLIDLLFDGLTKFANDGNAKDLTSLLKYVGNEVASLFKGENLEPNAIKVLHIVGETLLKEHSNFIKQILTNVYNKISTDEEFVKQVYGLIPASIREQIEKYVSQEDLNKLVKFIFANSDVKEVFTKQLTKVIESFGTFENINSFKDALKVTFKALDFDTIKEQIKGFSESFFADQEAKEIVVKALSNVVKYNLNDFYVTAAKEGNQNNYTESFISDFVSNILPLLKDLDIYEPILDLAFATLNKAKDAEDVTSVLKTLTSELLNIVSTKFKENPYKFVKTILDSPIISNNKEYLKIIVKVLVNKYFKSDKVTQFINNQIDANVSKLDKYVSAENLKALVDTLQKDTNTLVVINDVIDTAFEIDDLEGLLSNPTQSAFELLKKSSLLSHSTELSKLIKNILDSQAVTDVIEKLANNFFINKNVFTSETTFPRDFYNEVRKTVVAVIYHDPSLLTKLLVKVNEVLADATSWGDFASKLAPVALKLVNLNDFGYVKELLKSNIWDYSTKINEFIDRLFASSQANKLYADNLDKLVGLIPLNKIAEKLNMQDSSKLTNAVNNLALSAQFKSILKETLKTIIANVKNEQNPELALSSANNYNDLVKKLVSNDTYIATIKPQVLEIISNSIQEAGILDIIKAAVSQALKNEKVVFVFKDIEPNDLDKLIENIVGLYNVIDENFGISDLVFETVISYMKNNGADFSKLNILGAIKTLFADKITNDQNHEFETKIVKTFASISGSKLFTENKPQILQILKNVLGDLSKNEDLTSIPDWAAKFGEQGPRKAIELTNSILRLIPQNTLDKIIKYISRDDLEQIFVFTFTNNNFQGLLTKGVSNVIAHMDQFSDVKSYADIIKKLVSLVNLDDLKENVLGFINDLLTNTHIQKAIKHAILSALKAIGVYTDNYSSQKLNTIEQLSNNLKPLIDKVGLINEVISIVFDGLKEAGNQETPEEVVSHAALIPQNIANLINETVKKDPLAFVNKILNLDFIKSNYSNYIEIVEDVVFALKNNGTIQNLISTQVQNINSDIFNYTTKEHLSNLINLIIGKADNTSESTTVAQNDDFDNLLKAYFNVIKDPAFLLEGDLIKVDPMKFISAFKHVELQNALKTNLKSILNRVLASDEFNEVVTDVTNELAKIFHIDLGAVDRTQLTKELLLDTINWLEATKSMDATLDALIKAILTITAPENSAKAFNDKLKIALDSLKADLKKAFNFNKYKFVEELFKQAKSLPKNKDAIIKLIDVIYNDISQRDDVIHQIIVVSGINKLLDKYELDYQVADKKSNPEAKSGEIIELAKEILNLPEAKSFLHIVLEDVLTSANWEKFASIKLPEDYIEEENAKAEDYDAYSKLIQALVSDPKFKSAAVQAIRNWVYQINNSENFVKVLSKAINKILTTLDVSQISAGLPLIKNHKGTETIPAPSISSLTFSQLFDGVENSEALIGVLINNLGAFDTKLDLIPQLIDALIDLVNERGLKISTSDFTNKLMSLGKKIFSSDGFQEKVIETLKTNINDVNAKNLQKDVYTFFKNFTQFVTSNFSIGTIAWNAIPKENAGFKKVVDTLSLSQEDVDTIGINFKFFVDAFMNNERIPGIIENVTKSYLEGTTDVEGTKDWFHGLQKFLNVKENDENTTAALIDLFKSVLNDNIYARNIAHLLVNKALVFAGLDYSNDADGKAKLEKMVNLFVNNLGSLFEETDMFKSMIGSIISTIKSANGFSDFTSKVGLAIFNGLEFTEYKTAKKFLKASLITNNKEDIISITQDLITKLLTSSAEGKQGKIAEIIHTFNVGNILVNALIPAERQAKITSQKREQLTSAINDMLIEAVAQPELANLLIALLRDIFDRVDTYTDDQHNSYSTMLSELFNSPNAWDTKEHLKKWFIAIMQDRDNIISKGASIILQNAISNALNIDLTSEEDGKMLKNVVHGLLKTLTETSELDEAVEGIYETIKSTNFEASPNRMKDLTNGIIKGALSIILTADNKNISLNKILNKNTFLEILLENIGADNYVKLINRLFEASSLQNNTGIYRALKNLLNVPIKNNEEENPVVATSAREANEEKKLQNELNFGFSFDVGIFSVPGKFKALIKALFYPIYKYQLSQIMSGAVDYETNGQYLESEGYKAMFRLSSVLLLLIKEKGNLDKLFWSGWSPITVEKLFRQGVGDAFLKMRDEVPEFDALPSEARFAAGANRGRSSYNDWFIVGDPGTWASDRNYQRSQLLVYIYYFRGGYIDKYSPEPKITLQEAYFEALERGYLLYS
ncbi:SGNH/GDSL hydrolase family protein [Mycoplasma sp. VS30B]